MNVRGPWIVKVPGVALTPGARNAPDPLPVPTVTLPAIVPVPPSVPALTFTAPVPVPESRLFLTNNVPPVIVVDPVYVFDPLSVKVPVPGPFTLAGCLLGGSAYRNREEITDALIPIVNQEMRDLVAATSLDTLPLHTVVDAALPGRSGGLSSQGPAFLPGES